MSNINVFFPYYQCGDKARQKEIDLCLKNNVNNKHISTLIVLIDDGSELIFTDEKIRIVRLEKRPTYRDWIEMTKNMHLEGVTILCNSDIYFDDSILLALDVLKSKNTFLSLSRWELIKGKHILHPNPHWSQDVWGVNCDNEYEPEMLQGLEFPMGVPRCDNKIAYLFGVRGWDIKNPCKSLKSIHVHETELRTYHKKLDTRILGGVAYVHPGETAQCNAKLEIDVWSKKVDDIKSVAINKSLPRWISEAHETQANENSTIIREPIIKLATPKNAISAIKNGKITYKKGVRFEVYELDNTYYFKSLYTIPRILSIQGGNLMDLIPVGFIPPVLNTYIKDITDKPSSNDDLDFWQYPAATEKQAYDNHKSMGASQHVDLENRVINIYAPFPWATYVDRKDFSSLYLDKMAKMISVYKDLANEFKFDLKVHTVCQHIHWIRILESAKKVGITDLHLSHKYSKSEKVQKDLGYSFTLHGWSLIAVNYETQNRNEGMIRKPIAERSLLASFIGAHMPHYRDNSRVELFEAAKAYGQDDVFVDLGNEWHFNKVVYEEQVLQKQIDGQHIDEHNQRTFRYNSILSDSKFSLCPEGAGPNTLRFWESIAVGTIPVIFSDDLAIYKKDEVGLCIIENSIVWYNKSFNKLFEHLDNYDEDKLQEMQKQLLKCYDSIKVMRV